jgi:hypothetical protein
LIGTEPEPRLLRGGLKAPGRAWIDKCRLRSAFCNGEFFGRERRGRSEGKQGYKQGRKPHWRHLCLPRSPAIIDTALETHLGSVHEEISDLRTEVKKDLSELEERLTGKIDKIDAKLGAFENNEIDKRLQLEVRVTHIEERVGVAKSA